MKIKILSGVNILSTSVENFWPEFDPIKFKNNDSLINSEFDVVDIKLVTSNISNTVKTYLAILFIDGDSNYRVTDNYVSTIIREDSLIPVYTNTIGEEIFEYDRNKTQVYKLDFDNMKIINLLFAENGDLQSSADLALETNISEAFLSEESLISTLIS